MAYLYLFVSTEYKICAFHYKGLGAQIEQMHGAALSTVAKLVKS